VVLAVPGVDSFAGDDLAVLKFEQAAELGTSTAALELVIERP
jgi:hypothetical protein